MITVNMSMDVSIIYLVFITCLVCNTEGSFGSRSSGGFRSIPAHDIKTKSGLTQLYNKKVVSAQVVERPLSGLNGGKIGRFGVGIANSFGVRTSISGQNDRATHSGVVVTTSEGNKYLVHKGDGYGIKSQTVVVDAKHMSDKWKSVGPSTNVGRKNNIGNYVQAGGNDYRYRGRNCHDATKKMINN